MKLSFPAESVVTLDFEANNALPESERVRVTIKWPTVKEDGLLPALEFVDHPRPTKDDPDAKISIATDKSLAEFADYVLRHHVKTVENLDGVASGADLADLPIASAGEVVWATVIAFRAGPGCVLAKKKD